MVIRSIQTLMYFKEDNIMNFGYFDENNREYVITRPDTPATSFPERLL